MYIESNADIAIYNVNVIPAARPIIVAVDLMPGSREQILWACEYGKKVGAPVIVLHVVHEPASAPGFYGDSHNSKNREALQNAAARMLHRLLADMSTAYGDHTLLGCDVTILVAGVPGPRIAEVAELKDAQLIVIGHRKRSGIQKLLDVSVAMQLIKKSARPVVVIKH